MRGPGWLIVGVALALACDRPPENRELDSFGNAPPNPKPPAPPRPPPGRRDSSKDVIGGFEITSGVCYGKCIPHRVAIAADGRVTREMTAQPAFGGHIRCPVASEIVVPKQDLEGLVALARQADVTTLKAHYSPAMTDHSELTTTLVVNGRSYTITHPDELPAVGADTDAEKAQLVALTNLHQAIGHATRAGEWLEASQPEVAP